jgi:acetate kinase
MTGSVLVLNAGSSSLKFGLYALGKGLPRQMKGAAARLGSGEARLRIWAGETVLHDTPLGGPLQVTSAAETVFHWLQANGWLKDVTAVGHRIVHGGRDFVAPTLLDAATLDTLRRFVPLAPLHQPHNLDIAELAAAALPQAVQVACFDTAFHAASPRLARLYGLPRALSEDGVIAYGFHGLSYAYISEALKRRDGEQGGGRAIVAHLGSGASLCAMDHGRSVATTMGFSALEGLVMGSRCGSLDPGVVLHLLQDRGMTVEAVAKLLYEQSGLLGVSGLSSDMQTLLRSEDPRAAEAIDLFVYRAAREIGSLTAALGGLDTLVFTAGIGENAAEVRARIAAASAWLGVTLDPGRNTAGEEVISRAGAAVQVLVIATDEERSVAEAAASAVQQSPTERLP